MFSLLGLFVAVLAWSTEAKNVTVAKSLAIDPVGQARPSVVRSERQHPVAVEPHTVPGIEPHAAALGEMGNSFISEAGADAIGARVVAALQPSPHKSGAASVMQSNKSKDDPSPAPTVAVKSAKVFLRQPAEHKGEYKSREWFCDACKLVAGKGKLAGESTGCYTVDDFVCAGGEKCLMHESTCYFGRVELPQGIQVSYYSGFTGDPGAGAWDNACVGRTDRGTTTDPNFPELKGIVPKQKPEVCAMKFTLMEGYTCETAAGAEEWKKCGTPDYPEGQNQGAAHGQTTFTITAALVLLASFLS